MTRPNLKLAFSDRDELPEQAPDEIQTLLTRMLDLHGGHEATTDDFAVWAAAEEHLKSSSKGRDPGASSETSTMSTPSREEFDARLREITTQGENRALRTDNKIDEMLRRLEARDAVQDERLKNLADKLQNMASDTAAMRDSVGSLKTTIITTVIGTGLAITALVYTLNTSLFTAFESGKTTASALADASNKLTQVSERLDALSKQPPAVASPTSSAPKGNQK